jgi:hypothetical protein
MRKAKRFDRQIDDLLLTATTTLAMIYARRRVRRAAPKVLLGTGVVAAAGTVAAGAIIAAGTLGVGGAAAVLYRRRANAGASANGWQAPPTPTRTSFTDSRPPEAMHTAAE